MSNRNKQFLNFIKYLIETKQTEIVFEIPKETNNQDVPLTIKE